MLASNHIQALEPRRMLCFAHVGAETKLADAPGGFDIAVAENGMFSVATLSQATELGSAQLAVERYSAAGESLGTPLLIAQPVSGAAFGGASVSMDADGDAVVAYSIHSDGVFGGERIYLNRISKDGVVSSPVLVDEPTRTDVTLHSPSVSMDSSGGFFIGWIVGAGEEWATEHVRVRAYDAAAAPRAPAFSAASIAPFSSIGGFDMDASPDGSGAVVAWEGYGEHPDFISFVRISASEVLGHGGVSDRSNEYDAAVSVRADGPFVLGYDTYTSACIGCDPTSFSSYVRLFNPAGEAQGAEIALGSGTEGASVHAVAVTVLPDGGFVAAFIEEQGEVETLYAQRFSAGGVPDHTGPVVVTSGPKPGVNEFWFRAPVLAADGLGRVLIAYRSASNGPLLYRRMTSEIAVIDGSELYVFGCAGPDAISVTTKALSAVVTHGTQVRKFAANAVKALSINGFRGSDSIVNSTALPATLVGGDGSDRIQGGSGIDVIRGNSGNDSLWGGEGNDSLYGDGGVDSLAGHGGRDWIDGGIGADRIRGYAGRDKLFGGPGHDRIWGGESDDWLYGQGGDDHLFGEGGNDFLQGDIGLDVLSGNAGNDLLVANDRLMDQLFGDGGRDSSVADEVDELTSVEVRE